MCFPLEKNKKGGFFIMIKNRRTSGLLSMALATCLVVSAVPVQTVDSILGSAAGRVTAYAEETAQSTKPLTTLWKTQEVGTHEGTGTYAYDAAAKTVTVNGAGTKFDKSAGSDDLFYAYFEGKGDLTITAKMTVNNNGNAGYAGLLIRNTADEAGSASAALYADFANGSKNQIRYGYHKEAAGGGASQVNTAVTTASSDIYIKLEVSGEKAIYHVASTADFSDEKVKTQRSAILLELENKMSKEYRQQHIGKTEEVLIEEIVSENGKDYFMGFTPDYIRVKIACDTALDNSEYINTIKKVYMKELSDDGIVVTGIFEC